MSVEFEHIQRKSMSCVEIFRRKERYFWNTEQTGSIRPNFWQYFRENSFFFGETQVFGRKQKRKFNFRSILVEIFLTFHWLVKSFLLTINRAFFPRKALTDFTRLRRKKNFYITRSSKSYGFFNYPKFVNVYWISVIFFLSLLWKVGFKL